MITLEHLVNSGEDFGVHCPREPEYRELIEYIYDVYPMKQNRRINMLNAWVEYKEDTVVYPNLLNCNPVIHGRTGGPASLRRQIYKFSDLEVCLDLPIERSDMDISSMLGL